MGVQLTVWRDLHSGTPVVEITIRVCRQVDVGIGIDEGLLEFVHAL